MAADARTDVGEDNTHWMTGEGWRQASTVLLYPQIRIDAYNGGGVICQVENIIARHGPAKHQSPREGEHWSSQVKIYSPGVHRAGRHMPRGLPALETAKRGEEDSGEKKALKAI